MGCHTEVKRAPGSSGTEYAVSLRTHAIDEEFTFFETPDADAQDVGEDAGPPRADTRGEVLAISARQAAQRQTRLDKHLEPARAFS